MAAAQKKIVETIEETTVDATVDATTEETTEKTATKPVVDPNPTGYTEKVSANASAEEMREFALKFKEFAIDNDVDTIFAYIPTEKINNMPVDRLRKELQRDKLIAKGKELTLNKGIIKKFKCVGNVKDIGYLLGDYKNDSVVRLEVTMYVPSSKTEDQWLDEFQNIAASLTA